MKPKDHTGKRHYSRKGCVECKKKKLKCDETKPNCLHCQRGDRICDYNQIAKFSDGRTFTPKTKLNKPKKKETSKKTPENGSQLSYDYQSDNLMYDFEASPTFEKLINGNETFEETLIHDVTLLAHGLNDITMYGAFDDVPREDIDSPNKDTKTATNEGFHEKLSTLIVSHDLADHKNYLRLFYEKYSIWLFPFGPGKDNVCYNILMLQALEFPFVLNAVLSMTARYEHFCSLNTSDEYYQRYYFVRCCKGFAKIFEEKSQIFRYIEPLILTTLLLVTDSVAFKGGDWRLHLKAAHDLFIKYVDVYKKRTDSILLSTIWFAAFEILAVVANPLGGSLTIQKDFDIMMNAGISSNDNSLGVRLGLILPSGYNLFLGYSAEAISMFTTFARIVLPIKQGKSDIVRGEDLRHLFTKIYEAGNYYLASKDCLVKKDNPYHPNNHTGMLLPLATYGYTDNEIFSWFDISHKVHVDALHLKILVDKHFLNLPETSPMVQELVEEILHSCHFFMDIDFEKEDFDLDEELKKIEDISLWLDRRLLTVHWPLLTCGLFCLKKIHKLKIEFYFRCLIKMGARSLESSFEKVISKWDGGIGEYDYVPFV